MKFVAKTFLITFIWRRYKRIFISIALLFLSYFLISLVHNDYINYTKNSETAHFLGLSYLLKWLALMIATIVFYFFGTSSKSGKISDNQIKHMDTRKSEPVTDSNTKPDPFDSIRKKKTLKSKAESILEDKQ